jgi:predicted 3-demethylubiquinone-9 3-methyltransferase (glyoxalase superfamily)
MIKPCIVYKDRAEEAIEFYVSLFPNSKILSMQLSEADGAIAKGKVLGATFELDGREYLAFDGGPTFTFTEGVSLMVTCKDQAEVDKYWTALVADGGEEGPCGWCKDRFGLSWQIVPEAFFRMVGDNEHGDSQAVFQAMLKMKKMDIKELERAYANAA